MENGGFHQEDGINRNRSPSKMTKYIECWGADKPFANITESTMAKNIGLAVSSGIMTDFFFFFFDLPIRVIYPNKTIWLSPTLKNNHLGWYKTINGVSLSQCLHIFAYSFPH